jgi:hypothetical protein
MGQMNLFGNLVHLAIDYVVRGLVLRFFTNWEELENGRIQGQVCHQIFFID